MAFQIIEETAVNGISIKLMGHEEVPSFALVYQADGNLAAISHRTTDYGCARLMFSRSIALAKTGFTHPAWKARRKVEIAS